jgi:uncharacterized BrkB/YihY/UPF0761 family membrane protein
MKLTIQHFFLGLMIAFTISIVLLSVIMSTIFETFNLVYRSEKLRFLWQSLIGYVLTVGTIIACGLIFGWYHFGGESQNQMNFILISFVVYSLFYLVTWLIIWRISIKKKKELNKKLNEYKQHQFN